ncbi:hypothetical protein LCGC14_1940530 [marine sediment metagenome]|uniref:Uncharacterized protein n=1 Tax=marine sediment metagenome TaxID=412755 RepID=A0A0F9G8Z1_9ZZZZ
METTIHRDTKGNLTVTVAGIESPEAVTRGYQSVIQMLNKDKDKKEESDD